ncbi:MAG: histone deacetylase [Verrucomicrobia bacterium]|nr:histone deacetylase [Verrucomicrobiota bacterium]
MKIITDSRCTEYHKPGHPERPQRVQRSVEKLKAQTDLQIDWLEPLIPTDKQILRAHSRQHLESLNGDVDFDADTPAYPEIIAHARRSVGAALHALKLCRAGEIAFSLMRPPGHHATKNQPMGFCFLNNIAIAVLEAQASGSKRVAVFDFDVHHGNGTEDILLNRPDCAFFSVHQSPAYPGTGLAHRGDNCFNHTVEPDMPAAAYRDACSRALAKLKEFKPDLIAVSAGFDSYKGDMLCNQNMDLEDFNWIGKQINALKTPTFSLLEGGYSKALPELILAYLKGLNGK